MKQIEASNFILFFFFELVMLFAQFILDMLLDCRSFNKDSHDQIQDRDGSKHLAK
ncbi:hypothetical protein LguiB_029666 [Lonicera macranthoides]